MGTAAATAYYEKVSVEEVSMEVFDQMDFDLSVDDMDDVVDEMRRLAACLRDSEVSHVESPWTCYCEACMEARER